MKRSSKADCAPPKAPPKKHRGGMSKGKSAMLRRGMNRDGGMVKTY